MRAPPTHQVQGKTERILQLLRGVGVALRMESVALRWAGLESGGEVVPVGLRLGGVTSEQQAWEGC